MGSYGAADGTYPPRFLGMSCPIGIGDGNEAVRATGVADMLKVEGIRNWRSRSVRCTRPRSGTRSATAAEPKDWETYSRVLKKLIPAEALRSNQK